MTLLLLTGCGYFKNAAYDASEIVQVQVAHGKGAGLDIYATCLVGTGLGYYRMNWFGYGPRNIGGMRCGFSHLNQQYFGALVVCGFSAVDSKAGDLVLPESRPLCPTFPFRPQYRYLTSSAAEAEPNPQGIETSSKSANHENAWRALDCGFTFVPLNCGLRMDISPGKALEFVCGLFLIDLEGDNPFQIGNGRAKSTPLTES